MSNSKFLKCLHKNKEICSIESQCVILWNKTFFTTWPGSEDGEMSLHCRDTKRETPNGLEQDNSLKVNVYFGWH